MLPLYWIRSNNLGDALNPVLYHAITGYWPEFSEVSPKMLAIGSIMRQAAPHDIVWGTGCMYYDGALLCDQTTEFRAVRGPLTASYLRKKGIKLPADIPLGDPSSLLPRFIEPSKTRTNKAGFLPHYSDYGQAPAMPEGVDLLYPMTNTLELIRQITSCDYIISSSLHGIIVSEAYGIPAVWVELSDSVAGNGFKFRDYYAITERIINPMDWRLRFTWEHAKQIAYESEIPVMNLDRLLEVCPFKENHVR